MTIFQVMTVSGVHGDSIDAVDADAAEIEAEQRGYDVLDVDGTKIVVAG